MEKIFSIKTMVKMIVGYKCLEWAEQHFFKIHICPGPRNVTSFGRRILTDIIKVRITVGPNSDVSALTTEREGHRETQRRQPSEDGGETTATQECNRRTDALK